MSDLMRQIPFGQLINWALSEYKKDGSVFGIRKLYSHTVDDSYVLFGEKLELPFGPAAGPHTQLAQNLIAGYVSGARFFELKTVQKLDGEDLPVSKPCILAEDEGYNVEWSTELYVPQALEEYIKGWFAIKLLNREFGLGSDKGFIFNMSVGYDLLGIMSPKIDNFIESLKNAEHTECWKECLDWTLNNLDKFKYVDKHLLDNLKPNISNSITLSTLHGCPPDEIERIATYLLKEKGLHTFIKCNPTLLGYEYARDTMDKLGFEHLSFNDHHFKADLQFEDAVPMLKRLQTIADDLSLEFGVKLTNTFPVHITENELPGEEMYMSGRFLFPLAAEVANRLSKAFDGKLRISFSGGIDVRNVSDIIETGIWPVTLATTLLKPGGYQRLFQIAERLNELDVSRFEEVHLDKLQKLIDNTFTNMMYRKSVSKPQNRKLKENVPLTDCFLAPCRGGCPFGQDVPAYLRLAGDGNFLEALKVITERNPLPFITGTICSHNCMEKCTRGFYEDCVDIRAVKLESADKAYRQLMSGLLSFPEPEKSGGKVAVIGGGPAGLSAAFFLARAGRPVTLFEKRDSLGGIVRHVIPGFRISDQAIDNDVALVQAMGVDVKLNTDINDLEALRADGFESFVIATGAWLPGEITLEKGSTLDALEFLAHLKSSKQTNLTSKVFGENIAVIGGGNTAMDAARAAKRIPGVLNVSIVYRRTKRYMPANAEELMLAMEEGIKFYELLAPKSLADGFLTCTKMKLGEPDQSGRQTPVPTDEVVEVPADTVIAAISNKIRCNLCGDENDDIFIIGDAKRGPSTVAEAIADAAECAKTIAGISLDKYTDLNIRTSETTDNPIQNVLDKKGVLNCKKPEINEPERCLECATICENCVDVCPNRANVSLNVNGSHQIVHIDFMCNECGNCEVFCPYSSAPYLDKLTFYTFEEDFNESDNSGFLPLTNGLIRIRLEGVVSDHQDGTDIPEDIWSIIEEFLKKMITWL